jgi:surface protein
MFRGAEAFNQNLTSWNVSKVNNMGSMFACISIPGGFTPSAFQGDISNWNLAGLNSSASLDNFMQGKNSTSRYSTANYDALLIGWNNNKLVGANGVANWRTDLRPHFGEARYTSGGDAAAARAALVTYGWTITDGGVA